MTGRLTTALALAFACAACAPHGYYRERDGTRYEDRRHGRVDINSASARELARLPGVDRDDAVRIVANRPYVNPEALVNRGILGPRAYDRIEDHVFAGRSRHERARDESWRDDDWRDERWDDDRMDSERHHDRWYDDR